MQPSSWYSAQLADISRDVADGYVMAIRGSRARVVGDRPRVARTWDDQLAKLQDRIAEAKATLADLAAAAK